jgi:hypothetical protein
MLSPTQILLIIVVSVLSAVLAVIGIQVFLILKESKRSIEKFNKILEDAGTISSSITKPIAALSSSFSNLSGISGVLGWLFNRKKKSEEEKKDE